LCNTFYSKSFTDFLGTDVDSTTTSIAKAKETIDEFSDIDVVSPVKRLPSPSSPHNPPTRKAKSLKM